MMALRWWFFIVLILGINSLISAQQKGISFPIVFDGADRNLQKHNVDVSLLDITDFIAVSIRLEGKGINNQVVGFNLNTQKKKYILKPFHDQEYDENVFVSELIYLQPEEAGIWQITLDISDVLPFEKKLEGFVRIFIPESRNYYKSSAKLKPDVLSRECKCPQPDYTPRSNWGSNFHLNSGIYQPPATYTTVTHLIVHHSAGTNTSSNWKGVVASIFDFHVNTNKWQDVGYNWLIDPNGIIYEGRGGGDNVRGAHMCGYNNNTMGICVLGNFEIVEPSAQTLLALEKLLAYKACKEDISPLGSSNIVSHTGHMHHISGHKQGCAPNYTACPGQFLFTKLETLRIDTKGIIENECAEISANVEFPIESSSFIFPNPVENTFCISKGDLINVMDIHGVDVTSRVLKVENNCVEISDLPSGLYFVQVYFKDKIEIEKILKL